MKLGEARDGERGTNVVLGETAPSPDLGPICRGSCRIHLVYTCTAWADARSHMSTPAQPFNNPTTLFAIFLPRLTHSRPPTPTPPALQALNPALISLSLKPSPSSNASLQPRFSLLSPSVSLPLPSLPFPPLHRSRPLGLCATARLMRGRLSLPVL